MKIVFVWVCLLTKASAFPTEPPPDTEEKKPCCVGSPRLLFKGYDSKHRINVFLFEFPPLKNDSKSHVNDNVEHSNTTSGGNANPLSNTEEESQHEFAVTETNTSGYPRAFNAIPKTVNHLTNVSLSTVGTKQEDSLSPGISMNLSPANIHQHKLDPETYSGPRTVTLNDTEKYGKVIKSDIAVGDEAKNTEEDVTNGHNDVDGYYSTEGITLTDISGYSDAKVTRQDPNVIFPAKDVENGNMLDCIKAGGLCRNTSKYAERKKVIHPTTHKEVASNGKNFELQANMTQSSKTHTSRPHGRHIKLVTFKEKSNRQREQPKTNNQKSLTMSSTNRNSKHSSKQRQRYAYYDSSHHYRYRHHHKQSSSESTSESDSSQQFG